MKNSNTKNGTTENTKKTEKYEKLAEQANTQTMKIVKTKNKNNQLLLLLFLLIIILIFIICSFIFAFLLSNTNKFAQNIYIGGINVSGLTQTQALEKLNNELDLKNYNMNLTYNEYSKDVDLSTLSPSYAFESALSEGYSIGRSGNVFENNFKIILTFFTKKKINPDILFNPEQTNTLIETINAEIPGRGQNTNYAIENNTLIILPSTSGLAVDNESFINLLKKSINEKQNALTIPVKEVAAQSIDIESIYKKVFKNPVDASYTINPYTIKKEEPGLDFAISLDEAKNIISEPKEKYEIPLKQLEPAVNVSMLPAEAYPNELSTYSTSYATSNYNRATNIALATNSINNIVLMPGETFSYNESVGQRTAARGYKEAGVYLNGEVTTGIGGGICQVSSTLYNAVLLANLEIVERSNHTFKPSYVPSGQDATVSWGAPDFKFKNNRDYPIKIIATTSGKQIFTSIQGLSTPEDYEVKINSYQIATVPFKVEYKTDPSLQPGTQKVVQSGSNGCKTETYKILYKDGNEVSRALINSDTYSPHNQIIAVGK